MKLICAIAFAIGIILSAIYVVAWITLVSEHGAAEAMRIGFTVWPGNVIGIVLFALSAFLSGGCMALLKDKQRPR
jgi:hypothetical protein